MQAKSELNYSHCTNIEHLFEGRTGVGSDKITANIACDDILTVLTGTRTIKWNNGNTSVLDLTGELTISTHVLNRAG